MTRRRRPAGLRPLLLMLAALAAVWLGDAAATLAQRAVPSTSGQVLHAVGVLGGRVLGGYGVGLALRGGGRLNRTQAWAVGVPAALVTAAPILWVLMPAETLARLPGAVASGPPGQLAPFAAVVLGLWLAFRR